MYETTVGGITLTIFIFASFYILKSIKDTFFKSEHTYNYFIAYSIDSNFQRHSTVITLDFEINDEWSFKLAISKLKERVDSSHAKPVNNLRIINLQLLLIQ